MATAKQTAAKRPATKQAARKAPTAKSSAKPAAQKSAAKSAKSPAKSAAKPATKSATKNSVKPAAKPATKNSAKPAKKPAAKAAAAKTPPKTAAKTAAKAPAKAASKPAATKRATSTSKPATRPSPPLTPKATATTMSTSKTAEPALELPKPKFNKDGLGYTKDFDLPFIKEQYDALQAERVRLTGQALRLEAEAHALVEEGEMGDVKFDDEGGEGDSTAVERERDLALSAQAREAIDEIDAALVRITAGTYGYSVVSGRPIPKERLEALPWSSVLVEEKVGGIGRR